MRGGGAVLRRIRAICAAEKNFRGRDGGAGLGKSLVFVNVRPLKIIGVVVKFVAVFVVNEGLVVGIGHETPRDEIFNLDGLSDAVFLQINDQVAIAVEFWRENFAFVTSEAFAPF